MNFATARRTFKPDLDSLPTPYVCSKCGAGGCKLWHPRADTRLFCVNCACKRSEGRVRPEEVDRHGRRSVEFVPGVPHEVDDIADCVPAIPIDGTASLVRYGEVENEMVFWWSLLPTRPDVIDVPCEIIPDRPLFTAS